MSELKTKALSGMFWTSLQQFGTKGVGFIVSLILARLLLPAEFGLIAMIAVFIGMGSRLLDAGLGQSLIRTENPNQEDYSTVFYFNLVGSVLIYFGVFALAPFIASFYNQESLTSIIRWYSITFVINAFSIVQFARLTKVLDFKTQMKVSLPSVFIGGIVGIVLAYSGFGVWSLVWMAVIKSLTSTTQLWIYTKWKPSKVFNVPKFKYHFNYGYKLTLSSLLDVFFTNAYAIIIGKYFVVAQVGFYNRAESLKQFPVESIGAILNKVTFPLFADIKDDDVRLKSAYKNIMQIVVFLVAPLLLFMAALGEPLFRFLFTERWLPAVPYFQILVFNGILYPIHSYNLNILKVKGRSDLFLKLEIIKKALITLVVFISFQYGIYGLLYGSVLTSVLAFFINTHYTGKYLKYSSLEQIKDLLPIILLALGCGALVFFIDGILENKVALDILRLVLGGVTGSSVYLLLGYLFKMNSLTQIITIVQRK